MKKRAHRGDRTLDRTLRSRGSATGVSSSDRTLDRTLAANRADAGQQRPIEYREVSERRTCDRTCPVASDRTLAVSDQLIVAPTVRTTGHVRSVAEKQDFIPNGYFLSGAYKYNPQPAKWCVWSGGNIPRVLIHHFSDLYLHSA